AITWPRATSSTLSASRCALFASFSFVLFCARSPLGRVKQANQYFECSFFRTDAMHLSMRASFGYFHSPVATVLATNGHLRGCARKSLIWEKACFPRGNMHPWVRIPPLPPSLRSRG